jgi:hypothetical protein
VADRFNTAATRFATHIDAYGDDRP